MPPHAVGQTLPLPGRAFQALPRSGFDGSERVHLHPALWCLLYLEHHPRPWAAEHQVHLKLVGSDDCVSSTV